MAAVFQGDYAPAAPLLEESLARWRALGHRSGMVWTLEGLAYLVGFQGDLDAAGVHLEAGLAAAGGEASSARARLLIDLGQLAVLQADHAAARSRLAAGLALAADIRDVWALLLGLDGWAMLAAAEGRPERALRLAAAAASLQEVAGALLPGAYVALREAVLAPARSALGAAAGAAAWAVGRALSLDHAVAEALDQAEEPAGAASARAAETGATDPLTRREREVLRLIAAGKSSREIAEALSLSVRTVERHTTTIYAKLEVHNRAEATAYAFRRRLV
jgi:DNA-binding CsgD family transcriptional regulator